MVEGVKIGSNGILLQIKEVSDSYRDYPYRCFFYLFFVFFLFFNYTAILFIIFLNKAFLYEKSVLITSSVNGGLDFCVET